MYNYNDYETVTFDTGRWYVVGEDYFPSITTILGKTMDDSKKKVLDNWKKRVGNSQADQITKEAARRGTNIHLMCEQFLRGEDVICPAATQGDMNMFNSIKLKLKRVNKVIGQEVVLYSHVLGIAGRCDLVCEYDGVLTIFDYKTSNRSKTEEDILDYWIQITFYALAHNEMFGTDITQVSVLMGVENGLPIHWVKQIKEDWIIQLINKKEAFYSKFK